MRFKPLATRLLSILTLLSICGCGKSPWSDYVKEGAKPPRLLDKPGSDCPLLNADQIQWVSGPLVNSESIFNMTFREAAPDGLSIEIWMPTMNHGSAPVTLTSDDQIHFTASKIYFIMYGLWEIRLKKGKEIECGFLLELAP
jgi:hypothetical protein